MHFPDFMPKGFCSIRPALDRQVSHLLRQMAGLFFTALGLILLSRWQIFFAPAAASFPPVFPSMAEGFRSLSQLNLFLCLALTLSSLLCLVLCLQLQNRIALCHVFIEDYFSLLFGPSEFLSNKAHTSFLLNSLRKRYQALTQFTVFLLTYRLNRLLAYCTYLFLAVSLCLYLICGLRPLNFSRFFTALFFGVGAYYLFHFQQSLLRFCQTEGENRLFEIPSWQSLQDLSFLLNRWPHKQDPQPQTLWQNVFFMSGDRFFLTPKAVDYRGDLKNFWYLFMIHPTNFPEQLFYASFRPVGLHPAESLGIKELFVSANSFPALPSLNPGDNPSLLGFFCSAKNTGASDFDASLVIFLPPACGKGKWVHFRLLPQKQAVLDSKAEMSSLALSLAEPPEPLPSVALESLSLLSSQCFLPSKSFAVTRHKRKEEAFFRVKDFAENVAAANHQIGILVPNHPILFTPWED